MASTRKRANTAERWALGVLDDIDRVEGKSYVEHDDDDINEKVKELIDAAKDENTGSEGTGEWVNTWKGVLTDVHAVEAKKYVAKALSDAVLAGAPRDFVERLQKKEKEIIMEAREYRKTLT